MKKVNVKVAGATSQATSYQCPSCDHFEFEQISSRKVLEELRESPLKIRQKVVKLSQDRLGIYFNSNVVRSFKLKKGEELYLSIPDEKHILLERSP